MNLTYIFPGQGSQKIGMGEDFYNNETKAKHMFDIASDILKINMKDLLFKQNDLLNQTQFSQPAIFLVSCIAYELFNDYTPKYTLGHSLGEFSANFCAKSLSFEEGLSLVHKRGQLMAKACESIDAGMLAVIGIEYEKLSQLCEQLQQNNKKVYLANINNETQIVLAGIKQDLLQSEDFLKQNGAKRTLLLPMSVASHCPLLDTIVDEFSQILSLSLKDTFESEVISNVTANIYNDKKNAILLLAKQLTSPVLYTKSIQFIEQKSDCFIEFGADVLKGLNKRITKKPTHSIYDMKTLQECINNIQ